MGLSETRVPLRTLRIYVVTKEYPGPSEGFYRLVLRSLGLEFWDCLFYMRSGQPCAHSFCWFFCTIEIRAFCAS